MWAMGGKDKKPEFLYVVLVIRYEMEKIWAHLQRTYLPYQEQIVTYSIYWAKKKSSKFREFMKVLQNSNKKKTEKFSSHTTKFTNWIDVIVLLTTATEFWTLKWIVFFKHRTITLLTNECVNLSHYAFSSCTENFFPFII